MQRLRVGSVPFLVGRPLDAGLEDEPGVELVHAVPAELVQALRAGAIDVALVSSIELFRRPGYRYLEGLAVAGRGEVASVQLFLRRRIEEVRTIALDPASRAAATLVRILLAERAGPAAEFIECPPDLDPREAGTDAWLRIGDAALREALAPDAPPSFNPSGAWAQRTGLPFPFAVWIVRPGVEIEPWLGAFRRSRERGARRVSALASEAARRWDLPREACWHYLSRECVYDAGGDLDPALIAFRDAAARLGLCEPDLVPRAVAVEAVQRG